MSERLGERPILVQVSNLPENEQCLKNHKYKCVCCLSNEQKRRAILKELRQELGAYSFINLLDEGLAETYEQRRHQLCEGRIPTFFETVKIFLSIK